jgi:MFS family permease
MSLRAELAALPRPAWVLFAGTVVNRFGSFVLLFLMLYLRERGYDAATAGAIVAAYGVGALVSSLAGGHLADRLGRRETIAASMFGSAAVMLALAQARSAPVTAALVAAAGFTAELYRPAAAALLTDVTRAGERVTAFAVYRLAINLGFAAGPAVGGLLADRSFVYLFLGDAATSLAYGVIALVALPRRAPPEAAVRLPGGIREVFSDLRLVWFFVASVLVAFVFMQHNTTYPLQMAAVGLAPSAYGMLISINGLIVLAIELPLTRLTRRHPAPAVMALGALLVGAGFGLTGLASSALLLAGTVVIWTLGEIVLLPVATAYIADVAPPHMRGRYQGVWGFTFGLGLVLAPAVGGAVFARAGEALWPLCFVLCAMAAAMLAAVRPLR